MERNGGREISEERGKGKGKEREGILYCKIKSWEIFFFKFE